MDCCQSKENGFKCTCFKRSNTQQAEDDGQGDFERDRRIDDKDEEYDGSFSAWKETHKMRNHNDIGEEL
jgi:hypothetical protein